MGIGIGKGENAAQDAVRSAIESPLLETNITGAENVLLNITGGTEFSLVDMGEVSGVVRDMVSENANIIVGTALDENMKDEIKVTLIATGLDANNKRGRGASSVNSSSASSRTGGFDDDAVFSRRLKPGMEDINVPSFFRPKN